MRIQVMETKDKDIQDISRSVMQDIRAAENNLAATESHPKRAVIRVLTNQMQGNLYHLDLAVFTLCLAKVEDAYGRDSNEYTEFVQDFKDHATIIRDNPLLTDCWLCESALAFVESASRDLAELQDESAIDELIFSPVRTAFDSLIENLEHLMAAIKKDAKQAKESVAGTVQKHKF